MKSTRVRIVYRRSDIIARTRTHRVANLRINRKIGATIDHSIGDRTRVRAGIRGIEIVQEIDRDRRVVTIAIGKTHTTIFQSILFLLFDFSID